ncbi:coiled-coil domain-containing protein 115 [Tachysurus vachellii]|nr:coiled-coil domain-containing protein 115 [Tachysurus vachellii]
MSCDLNGDAVNGENTAEQTVKRTNNEALSQYLTYSVILHEPEWTFFNPQATNHTCLEMGLDAASLSLDQHLLYFMDQLEILEEKRQKLNTLIEDGWFNISKARYSMGNKQVSALQYASEMEPLVHVHASRSENGEAEFKCERIGDEDEALKRSETIESIGAADGGLRRRVNVKKKENMEEKDTSKDEFEKEPQLNTKSGKSQGQHQDPLKWFGILVPQNLKQAQAAFREVITLAAEISTLQSAIVKTRLEMQTQMKDKQKIASELKE